MRPEALKALTHLTKEQRKALQGLGIVDARKEQVCVTARRQLQLTRSLLAVARVFIMWIDNLNKHKRSRNPNEVHQWNCICSPSNHGPPACTVPWAPHASNPHCQC